MAATTDAAAVDVAASSDTFSFDLTLLFAGGREREYNIPQTDKKTVWLTGQVTAAAAGAVVRGQRDS